MTELKEVDEKGLETILTTAHPRRLLGAYTWLKRNPEGDIQMLSDKTGFNSWFLYQIKQLVELEKRLCQAGDLDQELLLEAKQAGLSDDRIGEFAGKTGEDIKKLRESFDMDPSYHFVDTCAGEINAETPYFYSTWGEIDEGTPTGEEGVIILASGP